MVIKTILQKIQEKPLQSALVLGFVFRAVQALYNHTPVQEDDYANVIGPALNALQTGEAVATVDYRLTVLPQIFYAILSVFHASGIDSTAWLVSTGYFVLGLVSLTGIWGMHRLGGNFLESRWQNQLTFIYSLHFLLPFFTTKAFLESFSLATVPWAFYFLTIEANRARPADIFKNHLKAGFFLGLTTVIRFQFAVVVLAVMAVMILRYYRMNVVTNRLRWYGIITGGAISLFLMAIFDMASNRIPLSTLFNYVMLNYEGNIAGSSYGSSAWYSYIGLFAGLMIPPVSLIFFYSFFRGIRKSGLVAIAFLSLVVFHSMIPNKLERFVVPVVPLFMLLSIIGLTEMNKKIRSVTIVIFWMLNIPLLLVATMGRSQSNIIDAAAYLRDKTGQIYLYQIGLFKRGYMGYDRAAPVRNDDFKELSKAFSEEKSFYLLYFQTMTEQHSLYLKTISVDCHEEKKFEPALLEKFVIYMNPEKNARRKATTLYYCSRIDLPK